jgi:hypothetical protein
MVKKQDMTLCLNCGVELDEGFIVCPLCGKDPHKRAEQESLSDNYPSDIIHLQKIENKRYLWELSGIIAFSGIAGCTIIDLIISRKLGWSLYSDISISAAWVILTFYQFAFKRTLIMAGALLGTILGALFLIDRVDNVRNWFFPVGFPLTVAVFIAAGTVIFLYRKIHLKGLNIIASSIIVLSGLCIITEFILDRYFKGIADLRWSLIIAVSIIPVALVFFFYHYRLKKGLHLDSFFHI